MGDSTNEFEGNRQFLFAFFAMRNELIQRDEFLSVVEAWLANPTRSLDQILIEKEYLSESQCQALLILVDRHIEAHDGAPRQSLKSLGLSSDLLNSMHEGNPETIGVTVEHLRSLSDSWTKSFVDSDASSATSHRESHEGSPKRIRFRFLRPHARGGLGEVSIAQDIELNRQVALKEIQSRYADDSQSRARFMVEAEVTGGLEHPGIVPVYGLGSYEDGRPYYAMRFIKGDSLKQAVERFHHEDASKSNDSKSVEFRKLLGRFVDVCQAIEYAHSRGVLHRDLKPGNIMLGKYGETLVVDWGLAKTKDGEEQTTSEEEPLRPASSSGSVPTQFGSAIGTPAFMPPEQAAGQLDLLGPASDVYSLGATLYFILAGVAPIKADSIPDLLARVIAGDFAPPSTHRSSTPKALEAICLKAMSKSIDDRYVSPALLAEDIERWLADEPVSAYREPITKRIERWVSKHRTLVGSTAAAIIVGTIGLAISSTLLKIANDELELANLTIRKEVENVRRAEATSSALNRFLTEDLLAQADPEQNMFQENTPVVYLLDQAAAEIEENESLREEPELEAAIRHTIGSTYLSLGRYSDAVHHLTRAHEIRITSARHPSRESLETTLALSDALLLAGDFQRAKQTVELAMELQNVVDIQPSEKFQIVNQHAQLLERTGMFEEALDLLETLIAETDGKPEAAHKAFDECRSQLSQLLASHMRDLDRVLILQNRTLVAFRERGLDENSREILDLKLQNADILAAYGRIEEALVMMREIVDIRTEKLPAEHPLLLSSRIGLAVALTKMRAYNDAAEIFFDVIEKLDRTLSPNHFVRWTAHVHLAYLYLEASSSVPNPAEFISLAETNASRAREISEAKGWNATTIDGFLTIVLTANVLRAQRRTRECRELLENTLEAIRSVRSDTDIESLALRQMLAQMTLESGDKETASQELGKLRMLAKEKLPESHSLPASIAMSSAFLGKATNDSDLTTRSLRDALRWSLFSGMASDSDRRQGRSFLTIDADQRNSTALLTSFAAESKKVYKIELKVPAYYATCLTKNAFGVRTSFADSMVEEGRSVHYYLPSINMNQKVYAAPILSEFDSNAFQLTITEGKMVTIDETSGEWDEDSALDSLLRNCPRSEVSLNIEDGRRYEFLVEADEDDVFVRLETTDGRVLTAIDSGGAGKPLTLVYETLDDQDVRLVILAKTPAAIGTFKVTTQAFEPVAETMAKEGTIEIADAN